MRGTAGGLVGDILSSIGRPGDIIGYFLSGIGWRWRFALLIVSPRPNISLNGRETGTCSGCADIVNPRDAALSTVFCPCLLFTTQVTLNPGDCDQGPNNSPGKRKGPAQLYVKLAWLQGGIELIPIYRECNIFLNGENHCSNGGSENDRASTPETVHFEEHTAEIRTW